VVCHQESLLNNDVINTRVKLLRLYYAATAIFIVLDYYLNINIRLAALEQAPYWRGTYYLFCFACLGLMYWRPAWSSWIASVESLITLSMLIISMALRVIVVTDEMIESGRGAVTFNEIINFAIAAAIAYLAWVRGARQVREDLYP
jgi:hypothetical protein